MQVPNDTITLAVALQLYHESLRTVNTLWALFSTVSLALIGGVYKAELRGWASRWVSLAFVLFAVGNSCGIRQAQETVVAATREIEQPASCHRDTFREKVTDAIPFFEDSIESLRCEIDAQSPRQLQLLHLALTGIVLVALNWESVRQKIGRPIGPPRRNEP